MSFYYFSDIELSVVVASTAEIDPAVLKPLVGWFVTRIIGRPEGCFVATPGHEIIQPGSVVLGLTELRNLDFCPLNGGVLYKGLGFVNGFVLYVWGGWDKISPENSSAADDKTVTLSYAEAPGNIYTGDTRFYDFANKVNFVSRQSSMR